MAVDYLVIIQLIEVVLLRSLKQLGSCVVKHIRQCRSNHAISQLQMVLEACLIDVMALQLQYLKGYLDVDS
jgi:hypothetical protein